MNIGERVKTLREERNISLADLSERTGLKEKDIVKIEEGALIPGLAPLVKISRVMGVRPGTFLDDCENIGPVVTRSGDTIEATRFSSREKGDEADMTFRALAHNKAGRHMEPFMIDVESGSSKHVKLSSHEGEEFIYVMNGSVEIRYGKDKIVLDRGDSIYYDSAVPHHVHTAGEEKAKILALVYTPF